MNKLVENINALYGVEGAQWLSQLDGTLEELENRLGITLQNPFQNLTHNYVAPAVGNDGTECVLKLGYSIPMLANEIEALEILSGRGTVGLFAADMDEGWLLLERCMPGKSVKTLSDEESLQAAVQTMKLFWRPIEKLTQQFKSTSGRMQRVLEESPGGSRLPGELLSRAQSITIELLDSQGESMLLHGDLHHDNILMATRHPFLGIDPVGIIGEREYEVGAMIRNPYSVVSSELELKPLLERRLSIAAELTGFDFERLKMWSFVQAVLATLWHMDDGTVGETVTLRVAQELL